MLVLGSTILADKSQVYVDIKYLDLVRDLQKMNEVSWGSVALAFLYEHLGDACRYSTKQLGGYMTLLQVNCFIILTISFSI